MAFVCPGLRLVTHTYLNLSARPTVTVGMGCTQYCRHRVSTHCVYDTAVLLLLTLDLQLCLPFAL